MATIAADAACKAWSSSVLPAEADAAEHRDNQTRSEISIEITHSAAANSLLQT
jgi:hypothetical protein